MRPGSNLQILVNIKRDIRFQRKAKNPFPAIIDYLKKTKSPKCDAFVKCDTFRQNVMLRENTKLIFVTITYV